MRTFVSIIAGLIAICAAGLPLCEAKEPRVKGDRLTFSLPDLDGKIVSSSDERLEGKVIFVTLWGTWCPPCRSEVPTFNDLQERYADVGLVILGIAFERDSTSAARRDRLREFSRAQKIQYLLLDGGSTQEFSDALPMIENVKGFPIEILIDRAGKVVDSRNGYGFSKKWAKKLEEELNELLSVEHPSTKSHQQ